MSKFSTPISFLLDKDIYPKEALIRTCYDLSNELHIELSSANERTFLVNIVSLEESPKSPDAIRALFYRKLTDFCLRHEIDQKTKNIRDTIITSALLEAAPVQK